MLAAFAVGVPYLDRPGVALVGFACLAFATPRPPLALRERTLAKYAEAIQMPTADAGKTPPSLKARLDPYVAAGVPEEFAYAPEDR